MKFLRVRGVGASRDGEVPGPPGVPQARAPSEKEDHVTFHLPPLLPNRINLPCPKGWWGNPVCGPCHCAVGKGFDPDCNKTNGQCHCKVRPGPQEGGGGASGTVSAGAEPRETAAGAGAHTRTPSLHAYLRSFSGQGGRWP